MVWLKLPQFTLIQFHLILFHLLIFKSKSNQDIRKNRYGSNCVVIETGVVTPYYTCYGCIIEEAMGCLNDMRFNKSGNIHPNCTTISSIGIEGDTENCCPKLAKEKNKFNLQYMGSAYTEALSCIREVGCGDSDVYHSLLKECIYTCPLLLDQTGKKSICLAQFNSSSLLRQFSIVLVIGIAALTFVFISMQ